MSLSPSFSSLLVLSCICVGFAYVHRSPFDKCTVEFLGSKYGRMSLNVPMPNINTADFMLEIPDECGDMVLSGVHVEVCDDDEAPELRLPEWPVYSPVYVRRKGIGKTAARVIINEFCSLPHDT